MNEEQLKEIDRRIRNASPLELASVLQQIELDDAKSTREVVDDVYKEFQSGESLTQQIVIPVFTSVIDGLLECSAATRKLRKKGLTSSRLIAECQAFSYENPGLEVPTLDGYVEYKNARDDFRRDGNSFLSDEISRGNIARADYRNNRSTFDDDSKSYYKSRAVADNGGRKNLVDEYTGERNITANKSDADGRRNDPSHRYQAQADHVVPLATVHDKLKANYALSDDDIVRIANSDDNFALTGAYINQGVQGKGGKKDLSNTEFIEDQNWREREGRDHLGLSETAKENMLRMEEESSRSIDAQTNAAVLANILGKGNGEHSLEYKRKREELGRNLTPEEKTSLDRELNAQRQQQILGNVSQNAMAQSKDYLVGNVILFILKPMYYEVVDIVRNGLKDGVGATSVGEAFKKRFGRVKAYVMSNAQSFMGNSVREFVKGFVSSLVEGFISLFVGIFRHTLKLVKEGIKILLNSGKVLFGKASAQMTRAEKGDAIVKIIGGGVIAICGIGIEALMNKIGVIDPWSSVLSTMLSGIASAMFMLLLDKIDLFSVKAEKRYARIQEIFDARISDLKVAQETMQTAALETMRNQYLEFSRIKRNLIAAANNNNIDDLNESVNQLASFYKVDIPYKNTEEFVDYLDNGTDTIVL